MKTLFFLLTVLFAQTTVAATVTGKLQNQGQTWMCVGRSPSNIVGVNCGNAPHVVMYNCTSGTAWGSFVCDGRIRFYNSNICIETVSAATIKPVPCNGSARQNFWFAYSGIQSRTQPGRYTTLSGSSIVLTGLAASRVLTYAQAWWLR